MSRSAARSTGGNRTAVLSLLLCACSSTASLAQSPREYAGGAPVMCYLSINPYHMYYLAGADTVGVPATENSVECQHWSDIPSGFRVRIDEVDLGLVDPRSTAEVIVNANGRVQSVNGATDTLSGHSDFLLRLPMPSVPLKVGRKWTDTATFAAPGMLGEHRYQFARRYEVVRQLDTLGQLVLEVKATGVVHYRDGWSSHNVPGTPSWIDVSGPVNERYYYAPKLKRLVAREWTMDLIGIGGLHGSAEDTIVAGLHSTQRSTAITPERYAGLARAMPGIDTTYTVRLEPFGVLFLHTVDRSTPDQLASGMRRTDGMMGTATARYAARQLTSYRVLWTSTTDPDHLIEIEVANGRLQLRGDTTASIPIPANAWAIADYAMSEQLVPVLLALPRDTTVPFDIYRPFPKHWDHSTARVEALGDGLLATLQDSTSGKATVLIMTRGGDLLFGDNSGPTKARRVTPRDDPRRRQADQLRALLKPEVTKPS